MRVNALLLRQQQVGIGPRGLGLRLKICRQQQHDRVAPSMAVARARVGERASEATPEGGRHDPAKTATSSRSWTVKA
jgi:hypothetical protein